MHRKIEWLPKMGRSYSPNGRMMETN